MSVERVPQDGFRTLTPVDLRIHRAQARISYAAVQLIRAQLIRRQLEQARARETPMNPR